MGSYGTLAADLLGDAREPGDLGRSLGTDLTEREVDWMVRREWAQTADDVLWRRSKLGLRVGAAEVATLEEYLCGADRIASRQATQPAVERGALGLR